MAGKTIYQLIKLLGAEEIQQQLKDLGVNGEKALKQIQEAVDAGNAPVSRFSKAIGDASTVVNNGFSKMAEGAAHLGGSLAPLAGAAAAAGSALRLGLAGAAVAAGAGLLALATSSARAISQEVDHAAAIGVTVDQYRALVGLARAAGVSQDEFTAALQRFSSKAAGEATTQLKSLIDLAKQVAQQMPQFGDNFLRADSIQQKADAIKRVAEQIKGALQSIGDPSGNLPLDNFTRALDSLATKSPAVRQAISDLGNDISKSQTPFEKLDALVTKSEGSFRALGIALIDSSGKARGTFDVFLDFADKISKLPDGFQKAATVAQFFGRAAGPELVSALNQGRAGVEQIAEALRKAGIAFDEDAAKKAAKAKQELLEFDQQLQQISRSIGTFALPGLNALLEGANDAIKNFIATLKDIDRAFENLIETIRRIGQISAQAFNAIVQQASGIGDALGSVWQRILTAASQAFDSVKQKASELFAAVANVWQRIATVAQEKWALIKSTILAPFGAPFQGLPEAVDAVMQAVVAKAQAAWDAIKNLFSEQVGGIFDWIATAFDSAVQTVTSGAQSLLSNITSALSQPIGGIFDWLSSAFDSAMQTLIAKAQAAWQQIKDIFSSIGGAFTGGGEADGAGFARGGYTGDIGRHRVAGVVHGNEYVEPAWVVARPGVLQFLDMLRRTGDLSKTIQRFVGGFSMGGLVDRVSHSLPPLMLPGYAGGGLVAMPQGAGLHPVTLNLGSGRSVAGLSAPPSVIEQLRRELAVESMASFGRQPLRGRKA